MRRGCAFALGASAFLLAVLVIGGAGFQWVNAQPWFCNTCHEMALHFQSWQASTHGAKARCLDCHAEPGLRGFIEEKARGAEQLVAHFTGNYPVPLRIIVRVKNDQCLACHPDTARIPDMAVKARHDVHLRARVLCADCHSRIVHNRTGEARVMPLDRCDSCHQKHLEFPMVGAHAGLNCTRCHAGDSYSSVPRQCQGCHDLSEDHVAGVVSGCQYCHTPVGWRPARTDHSAFPLAGRHAGLACQQCHAGGRFEGTSPLCESCHRLPANHIPGIIDGCGECHTPQGWKPAKFDHTFFPLIGRHQAVACAQCHPDGRYQGTSGLCESCHQVPANHAVGLIGNCQACHTPEGWTSAHFDHSRFPLTGAHRSLSCLRCHEGGVFQGLSTACAGCHSAPASHAGMDTNCAHCHTTNRFSPSTFRHPAEGEHIPAGEVPLSCRACHAVRFAQASCTASGCHSSNNPGDD